jgi:hypothetical protein
MKTWGTWVAVAVVLSAAGTGRGEDTPEPAVILKRHLDAIGGAEEGRAEVGVKVEYPGGARSPCGSTPRRTC